MTNQASVMLTSDRLRFETWILHDLNSLYELHSDPLVQKSYAPGPHKWTMEGIAARLGLYMKEQETVGFTKWKLSLADGTFIGRAGWSRWGQDTLEIGYAIKPQYWGNGYASEAAQALLSWARSNRAHDLLVGFALPNNAASLRILEKLGMKILDHREIAGAEFAYYQLET